MSTGSPYAEAFKRDGFVLIPKAIDHRVIGAIRREWEVFTRKPCVNLLPADAPAACFWRHVPGERKRMRPLSELPGLEHFALSGAATQYARQLALGLGFKRGDLRLLETVIFEKPPRQGGALAWHTDASFFPFFPHNQLAAWIPLDPVDRLNGTIQYAAGSQHTQALTPVDLHTGEPIGEPEDGLVPADPAAHGHEVVTLAMTPGDIAFHAALTWHASMPNPSERLRRALSLRFLLGRTRYAPRAGTTFAMCQQAAVAEGEPIRGPSFPVV
ncbi:MAG: phytanoyl-CoA dioxygenase family protein [Proteobacteria bacterium]|nr:phytanoyl-CoA dioxygenase family protein [Pseudomonadota bacterium]